uniref:Putative bacterial fructose-1,6-bisphosphatase, glpX-encoded n=1 Tax=uncultured marine microorganism HF4000_ANIW137J11 TaxID=455532 RepID=B3T4P2_9ZZZZ|nr:putative bacterial fructose-1,6-bisphosphatase, glpX-encoded [uncultured marine microorganism HF4000_ANIW137J11]
MRGCGDNKAADAAAVAAMRTVFDTIAFDGRVAIGEGERDEAPMLWIGEPLGSRQGDPAAVAVDIAIDPLECTNNCARDEPDALAVLAAAPRGALLHAPDCYMDKIAGPVELAGHVSLDAPVADNLRATADMLGKPLSEVRVIVLERPRHARLVAEIRAAGAQLQLIGDGDIAGALRAATGEADLLLGIGAAPEGVITATALRGLGGFFEGRLHFHKPEFRARAVEMLGDDVDRLWQRDELCSSDDAVFVATGVCDGWLPGPVEGEGGTVTTSRVISVADGRDETIRHEHAPAS